MGFFGKDKSTVTMHSTEITEPAKPRAEAQSVEKTFYVDAPSDLLERLQINVPGLVYVTCNKIKTEAESDTGVLETDDPEDTAVVDPHTGINEKTAVKVRVSSSSASTLQNVDVRSENANELFVTYLRSNESTTSQDPSKDTATYGQPIKGHLLTEIELPDPNSLQHIEIHSSCDVVVEDSALVMDKTHAQAKVSVLKGARMYLHTAQLIHLKDFRLAIIGCGEVYLMAQHIKLDNKFAIAVAGGGRVQCVANSIHAHELKIAVAGAGNVDILTKDTIGVKKSKLSIAGSGDVRLRSAMSQDEMLSRMSRSSSSMLHREHEGLGKQKITIIGSGFVDSADLMCDWAQVNVTGHGTTVVQAKDSLSSSVMGASKVLYVGEAPRMQGKGTEIGPVNMEERQAQRSEHKAGEVEVPTRESAFTDGATLRMPLTSDVGGIKIPILGSILPPWLMGQ